MFMIYGLYCMCHIAKINSFKKQINYVNIITRRSDYHQEQKFPQTWFFETNFLQLFFKYFLLFFIPEFDINEY